MQNKTYAITAMIDEEEHTLAEDIKEEELEETLHRLTRRHELKNVGRFELREEKEESSRGREAARGKRESGGASTASDDFSRAKRSVASRTILNTSSITRT